MLATFHDGLRVRGPVEVASIGTDRPAGGPTFVSAEDAAERCDHELLDLVAAILQRVRARTVRGSPRADHAPEAPPGAAGRVGARGHHQLRGAAPAGAGVELVDAAFAVSDELDRVPYTYALRTVTGHGDSLVLLSKVAVMPDQRIPPVVGLLLYSTIEPLVAAHRALHG